MFDFLDESLEFYLGGPEVFGLGAYGVVRVDGDAVVVCLEGGLHAFERRVPVFILLIVVREDNVGDINRATRDINRLECVDERLVEAFDVVVVLRADDGGKGRLGICEEIFRFLRVGHGSDGEGYEEGAQW